MRFHFIGTDYAPPPLGREWARPIAASETVTEHVAEYCYRIPYFEALYYLMTADALIVVGSNDPTYSASKIFPYLLAHKPLLTIVHENSLMLELARGQNLPATYGFPSGDDPDDIEKLVTQIHDEWFVAEGFRQKPNGDLAKLAEHTATGMSQRLAAIFDTAATPKQP